MAVVVAQQNEFFDVGNAHLNVYIVFILNNPSLSCYQRLRPFTMVKGRQGFLLEGWKFAIYLLVPITASIYYNNPENQKKSADYWQYVKYPANPSTGWKEQIELMQSQQKQREEYRQQLQLLNDSSTSKATTVGGDIDENDMDNSNGNRWRWLRWVGLGPKAS